MTSSRHPLRFRVAMLAAAACACSCFAASAQAARRSYYVSLGDSLSVGAQPDANGRDRPTSHGYVDFVAHALAQQHSGLRQVRLGCNGGTTTSLMSGRPCNASYGSGSPLEQAEAFLGAHHGRIALVTIDIGDNDIERCLMNQVVDNACLDSNWKTIKTKLPKIARRLRAAAGAGAPIVGIADYDQFLAYWLDGGQARQFSLSTVPVVLHLANVMSQAYGAAGVTFADAGAQFRTSDSTHKSKLAGHGRVPTRVQRICTWTWACSAPPVGFDDHANPTGYKIIGQAVLATFSGGQSSGGTPAP